MHDRVHHIVQRAVCSLLTGCNPNARRLQEAGYRDLLELQALGQPEPEVWPSSRLIKKLRTKLSLSGGLVLLYYRERPECGPKDIPKVKLYSY